MKRKLYNSVLNMGANRILDYLGDEINQKNLYTLLSMIDNLDREDAILKQRDIVRNIIEDKNNNWYRLLEKIWELDNDQRRVLFKNLIVNATINWASTHDELEREHNCNIPWALLLDPTSACNLKCSGCWASEYGRQLSMNYETLDCIIEQGKELGIHMYIYSGGEPLVRKRDILRLCETHSDCIFLAFTNGSLIDEEFADNLLRVKNFIPAISIEGYESTTDSRRGKGVYRKAIRAMELLRERNLGFGASLCYTSANVDVIGSEEFMDDLVDMGCLFAWYFTYMPVGAKAITELLTTSKQREFMYRKIRQWRNDKPIFTIDFWNDGEYVDGCIAGGKYYLHINANGDVEPCAFIHYSDSNIYKKTLLEALKSPLFMQYRENQPFNKNHLRPCPLLDNKGVLAKMVEASGAVSTEIEHPEDVHHLCQKCEHAADSWAAASTQLWNETLKRRNLEEARALNSDYD